MPSNDIHDLEQSSTPLTVPKANNEDLKANHVDSLEEAAMSDLGKRANNFLSGHPVVHQHKNPLPPGQQQSQAQPHPFGDEGAVHEKSKRGRVVDPEHDHRLTENHGRENSEDINGPHDSEHGKPHDEDGDGHIDEEERRRQDYAEKQSETQVSEKEKIEEYRERLPEGFGGKIEASQKELNELTYHIAYGSEIRRRLGTKPTVASLGLVREYLKQVASEVSTPEAKREIATLTSRVANLLIKSGALRGKG